MATSAILTLAVHRLPALKMIKTLRAAVVVATLSLSEAFFSAPQTSARDGVVMMGGRKATPLGRTTSKAGKEVRG